MDSTSESSGSSIDHLRPTSLAKPSRGRSPASSSNVPAKRSRTRSGSRRDLKRQRQSYRNEYRLLLNTQISTVADPFAVADAFDEKELPGSQVGLTNWTPEDKRRLFTALDRLGRHNLPALSRAVPGKSPLEVQQYLLLPKKGLREQHSYFRRETLLRYADIPAAAEVSPKLCLALQDSAAALSVIQTTPEQTAEKVRCGRFWKVTVELAWEMEEAVSEVLDNVERGEQEHIHEDDENDLHWFKLKAVATLFDLPIWLELSTRVFMNAPSTTTTDGADEDSPMNWSDVFPREHPSVFATALTDFYNLAMSLTKRLAYAAHFQALSRLRATDVYTFREKRKQAVTKADVRTAVDVLGLKPNSRDFWTRTARRNGLEIYDPKAKKEVPIWSRRHWGPRLAYNEVERRLALGEEEFHRDRRNSEESRGTEEAESELSDEDLDARELPESTKEDDLARLHEEEAECVDQANSVAEERRLWEEVLGQRALVDVAEAVGKFDEEGREKRPPVQRKTASDLKDFMDSLEYIAPWEVDGYVFEFERAREKLQRRATKRRKSRGSVSSDSDVEMEDIHAADEKSTGSDDVSEDNDSDKTSAESSSDDTSGDIDELTSTTDSEEESDEASGDTSGKGFSNTDASTAPSDAEGNGFEGNNAETDSSD